MKYQERDYMGDQERDCMEDREGDLVYRIVSVT